MSFSKETPAKPEGGYAVHPDRIPFVGYGGEETFERAFEEEERRTVNTRQVNRYIRATGQVPAGVVVDIHAASHPAFSPDDWRAYQEAHGVVQGPIPPDQVDSVENLRNLEAAVEAEKRRRNVS